MDHDEIMDRILDHYEHPRNQGHVGDANLVYEGGNPGCGDVIKLFMKIGPGGVIENLAFEGTGCMVSLAGTSMLLEDMNGRTVSDLEELKSDVMMDYLGKRIMTTRPQCALAGYNTLKNALTKWKKTAA